MKSTEEIKQKVAELKGKLIWIRLNGSSKPSIGFMEEDFYKQIEKDVIETKIKMLEWVLEE